MFVPVAWADGPNVALNGPVAAESGLKTELGRVVVTTLDGQQLTMTIDQVDEDGKIVGEDVPDDLMIDRVRSIETQRQVKSPEAGSIEVQLSAGGRIYAKSVSVRQGEMTLTCDGISDDVSLESVVAILWRDSSMVDQLLGQRSTDSDQVIVDTTNGERVVAGVLEEVNATHVVLNYRGESRKIAIEKVVAVLPADLGLAIPGRPTASVKLADSSKIVGQLARWNRNNIELRIAGKHMIRVPAESIVRIDIDAGRVVYLSDLTPSDVQRSSAFAASRPWQKNRSIEGNPLRLTMPDGRTRTFENGIGTQSFTRISFQIPEGFDTFAAIIGIDRETDGLGDCEMIVEADGIRIWAGRIRGSEPARDLKLDIRDARELTLIVDYGEDFDLADHADWCLARLIRTD